MNRSCDGCTKCCEGWLSGKAYDHNFYRGRPCFFLNKTCSIYDKRPENPCRLYECGWLKDETFPHWMKPDLINAIINKRFTNSGIEFYTVIEAGSILDSKTLSWLVQWALNNNKNIQYNIDGGGNNLGSQEFLKEMNESQ